MSTQDTDREEQELLRALRTLAREDEGVGAPPRVEARVMRAFDETLAAPPRGRGVWRGPLLKVAAMFAIAVVGGYWWSTGGAKPPVEAPRAAGPALSAPWPSSEELSWLDPEPASLQIVHLRVTTAALAAQGYVVSDPDGDDLVDLEVILGQDGLARGVRLVPATAVIYQREHP